MPDDRHVTFKVLLEEPRQGATPLFSNHVGIARAGTEVQFEFGFLDINAVATILRDYKEHGGTSPVEINGKSIAKIVMPLHVFLQLKEHLQGMFNSIEHELQLAEKEEGNESSSSSIRNVQVV